MNRRILPSLVLVLALALAMRPTAAAADTIVFLGEGKGTDIDIHSPTLGDLRVRAGELNWSAASSAQLALEFYTYCVDANHYLNSSQSITIQPSSLLSSPGVDDPGGKAAWLMNTYAPTIHSSGSDLEAAALQIAIWAALYNNDGSLTTGAFHVNESNAVTSQAQVFLNNLFADPTAYHIASASLLDTDNGQDQMIPTPEPGTLLLLGSGLAATWIGRRRVLRRGPSASTR